MPSKVAPRSHRLVSALLTTAFGPCLIICGLLVGQTPPPKLTAIPHFYPVGGLTKSRTAQVTLRGARLAHPKDWPASFYSVFPGGSCTATLVGPRALLTAAHCVSDGGAIDITMEQTVYTGTCTRYSLYNATNNSSADYALCLMSSDVTLAAYETINLDQTRLKPGTELLLTGFGCTRDDGSGGDDHNYRVGEVNIGKLPAGTNNFITTSGEVALCYGDSGGPAFLYLDSAKKKRVQVSVNSEVHKLQNGNLGEESYLSSLSTPVAKAFLNSWSSQTGARLCGLSSNTDHCRNQ